MCGEIEIILGHVWKDGVWWERERKVNVITYMERL